ncbi:MULTISPECIES: hypothetical protein [unclassified Moorena]|uniref:hypothetical protein n=1 Tax=unclassified Moorena TaxID=2683338 RepID=UPI0013C89AB7|nr:MULTISPECIES: hypothetical protein [unclassified Moorena]NEO19985.1 hypothetical protein [Moorena sp. SIO4A5]NEQ59440.1 hypothetical protein [Moorena sp. SIO4A1]
MSAISYQLSAISYQLSAISYQLSVYVLRTRYANSYQFMCYAHATRTAIGWLWQR